MPIRDMLASEDEDAREALRNHARGLGDHGRPAEGAPRFTRSDTLFGAPAEPIPPRPTPFAATAEPIMGERIQRPRPVVVSADGATRPYGIDDPVFSRRDVPSEVERVPFGAFEQVLAYPQRPGYRRYWANDTPGRIQRFKSAGYGHVIDDVSGEPVSRITDVANGRGRASYLMETPMRWYQQDMGKQAAALQRRLDDIRNGKAGQDVTVENSYSDIRIERS